MATAKIRLLGWNTKAPSLSLIGKHRWLKRRTPLRKIIGSYRADIVALIETGSGGYLTWWKHAMKKYRLRWARHGAKWQNIFLGTRAHYLAGGLYSLPREWTLNSDNKEMAWCVFELEGLRWIIGVGHPENNQGHDKRTGHSADTIREQQVLHHLAYLDHRAEHYGVPRARRLYYADVNAPEGNVLRAVVKHTRYRDAFTKARSTHRRNYTSNNKWLTPRHTHKGKEERIDLWLVDESVDVALASNREVDGESDHNPEIIDIIFTISE